MRKATLIAACVVAGAFGGTTDANAHRSPSAPIIHEIDHLRGKTNQIRREVGRPPLPTSFAYRQYPSRAFRLRVLKIWKKNAQRARRLRPHLRSVWARLAACESNGTWAYNGRVAFDGGLQFHPQTWTSYRLRGYPRYAWQATPVQQIRVAKLVQREQGWRAWPACSRQIGLR
jgi:hypothetical protein